jgi:hypothetical protein
MKKYSVHHHGMSKAKGCEHVALSRFSKLFTSPGLAVSEEAAAILGGPGGLMHDFDGKSPDSEIPAGYIFFAQFIDHDITLDTTSSLRQDPPLDVTAQKVPNIRSVSLDLDCVYGFGPEASPHIYDSERPGRLAENPNGYDLARSPGGVALIGDPRNDENIFVSQMQLLFHRFHNKLYNERVREESGGERFEEAQKQTRYHYQWLVLFDFLKRLCDREVYKFAAKRFVSGEKPLIYAPDKHHQLNMPVEFSVAAYRVGHTMVRSVYAANSHNLDIDLFDERFGTLGFSAFPEDLVIDWRYLLDVASSVRPRMSKAIDPLLANEIQDMPRPVVNSNNPNDRALAFRNMLRSNALGLPSGQDAAAALNAAGYTMVDPAFDLKLDDIPGPGWSRLDALATGGGPSPLRTQTPLFYYLLRESEVASAGQRLGPVGSAILMEVFGGILTYCNTGFLNAEPDWNPDPCVSKERWQWLWKEGYKEKFKRKKLIEDDDYYPFDLADVVRFVENRDPDGNRIGGNP